VAADVIVTELRTAPETPVAGEQVQLFARIRNAGGQTTGTHVGVAYLVDGQYLTWGAEGTLGNGILAEGVSDEERPISGTYRRRK